MSVSRAQVLPDGESAERAAAKETLWRLAALAFGHPTEELQAAFETGRFHAAFAAAWTAVTGRSWPRAALSPGFAALEAGYIRAFLHGPGGKPVASLLAGDHERLLAGHARPVFMLNIAAFYKHFGLTAATGDEGRSDEPDHLASLLEFMAVLAHLEARALGTGADPSAPRRAQRDFLHRYLVPLLEAVAGALRRGRTDDLDASIAQLVEELPGWARAQAAELEARVGPYRAPDDARASALDLPSRDSSARTTDQNLWG